MKVQYQTDRSKMLKVFNESLGISLNKENILRNKKLKYINYITFMLLEFLICTIFLLLMFLVDWQYNNLLSKGFVLFGLVGLILIFVNSLSPILLTNCFFRRDKVELQIDKEGITFTLDDDQLLTTGWSHIKGVIIGKYSLNIITDYPYYFYFEKEHKKEILDAIKKYNDSIRIVK